MESLFPSTDDPTDYPQPTSLTHIEEAVDAAISLSINVVDIAEASGRQNLLAIVVPLLCDLLCEQSPSLSTVSEVRVVVHQLALHSLRHLGSRYTAEFRHVVGKIQSLKPRLEAALRAGSGSHPHGASKSALPTPVPVAVTLAAATIKLKREFNNFE